MNGWWVLFTGMLVCLVLSLGAIGAFVWAVHKASREGTFSR